MDGTGLSKEVQDAIEGRRSVRGFLDRPVPQATVERLLRVASHAPSGSNTQPWIVHVVTGAAKRRLIGAIMTIRADEETEPNTQYRYYPEIWPEPYLARRRQLGWSLYGLLGIAKGDRERARAWHDRNFDFFGAPVGLIPTLDRRLAQGALIDIGMFAENFMVAASSIGLATCPQAAFAHYHDIIAGELTLRADEMMLFGIALGFEDPNTVQNSLRAPRAPVSEFSIFHEQ
jgi:nitroreductase